MEFENIFKTAKMSVICALNLFINCDSLWDFSNNGMQRGIALMKCSVAEIA